MTIHSLRFVAALAALAAGVRAQDECTSAQPIGPGVTFGSTAGATTSAVTGRCGSPMGNDVWYSYTASADQAVRVSTCPVAGGGASFNTCLAVFAGTCGNLAEIACADDTCGTASEVLFSAAMGRTYFIAVGGSRGESGLFFLSLDIPPPPPTNDNCAAAQRISAGVTTGTNVNATGNLPGSCATADADVWYVYAATGNGVVTATMCPPAGSASFDPVLAVFSGDCGALAEIGCNDNTCGVLPRVTFPVTAGQDYWIAVAATDGGRGSFAFELIDALPAHDECTGALPIETGATSAHNYGATRSPVTGRCGAMGSDVWYVYTPAQDGTLNASMCQRAGSATFDTCLAVFTGPCGAMTEVACNDNHCALSSEVEVPVTGGQPYYVAVGGAVGAQGAFVVSLRLQVPGDECSAPRPIGEGITLGTNRDATTSPFPAQCGIVGSDVWYRYRPVADGVAVASFCAPGAGADFDTALEVYAECQQSLIACNGDHCGDQAEVRFPVRAGEDYLLAVGGDGPEQGDFALSMVLQPSMPRFEQASKQHLPLAGLAGALGGVAIADCDGDGDQDLVFAGEERNRLYFNDGSATFTDVTDPRLPANPRPSAALAAEDLDGDGDVDLVFGNHGRDKIFINDGGGTFSNETGARLPTDGAPTEAIACFDADLDGDLDLFFGTSGTADRLYMNDGSGVFVDASSTRLPSLPAGSTRSAVPVDVEGDGDFDLVVGGSLIGGAVQLYRNNGSGFFTDVSAVQLPIQHPTAHQVRCGDLDGDGDPDLVIAYSDSSGLCFAFPPLQNRILINDGRGRFADETANRLPAAQDKSEDLACFDVDGDADLDIVVANVGQNLLYRNDGTGHFSRESTGLPAGEEQSMAVAADDLDGDGDPDLVFATTGAYRLQLNDGVGRFAGASGPRLPLYAGDVVAGAAVDVDGDLDLDLVLSTLCPSTLYYAPVPTGPQLLLNSGRGTFANAGATAVPTSPAPITAVTAVDVDRDGDQDLLLGTVRVTSSGGRGATQDRLLMNDGAGRFVDATNQLPQIPLATNGITSGDLNGDGSPDLVLAVDSGSAPQPGAARVFLNRGDGVFDDVSATHLPQNSGRGMAAALGDVDRDGDLDLILGKADVGPKNNRLYLNDGSGSFVDVSATFLPGDIDDTRSVVCADFDGDGDLDLFFANFGVQDRLFLGDGTGRFADATATHLPMDAKLTVGAASGDLDEDGDLDLVLADAFQSHIYLNDGAARFSEATGELPGDARSSGVVLCGDFDRDADLDLLLGSSTDGGGRRLYFNRSRQLEAPLLAVPGRAYTLRIQARSAPPRPNLALIALSTGESRVPLPWGILGLDPTQLVALPPIPIAAASGQAEESLVIPAQPALAGVPFYLQALLTGTGAARLTNVEADTVWR
ncbi:MAG: VCBS repeat-containing protein [Planctomycetota bacterium]